MPSRYGVILISWPGTNVVVFSTPGIVVPFLVFKAAVFLLPLVASLIAWTALAAYRQL